MFKKFMFRALSLSAVVLAAFGTANAQVLPTTTTTAANPAAMRRQCNVGPAAKALQYSLSKKIYAGLNPAGTAANARATARITLRIAGQLPPPEVIDYSQDLNISYANDGQIQVTGTLKPDTFLKSCSVPVEVSVYVRKFVQAGTGFSPIVVQSKFQTVLPGLFL